MPTISSVNKHFITAQESFTTTLSSSITSGASTVPLNSVAGYADGDQVAFVIDPADPAKKQVVTGTIDSDGSQLTGCVWTEGTNQAHTAGATVVDYTSATHQAALVKGLEVSMEQSGALKGDAVRTALGIGADSNAGWDILGDTPDSVTHNGNRSYDLVFNGEDHTDVITPGMRLRSDRTVAAPLQCADLEEGSSQYFRNTSPSGITFTQTYTAMAWVKLESYEGNGGYQHIISRRSSDGWGMRLDNSALGRIELYSVGTGTDYRRTYTTLPLNKWVHIAGAFDVSGTSRIYIDGVEQETEFVASTGTAIGQTGNLEIGRSEQDGADYFDGKIAQVGLFDSQLSESTIREYMTRPLTGSETDCIGAWSFNNDITDLTGNNDMTAVGGATATDDDSPFGNKGASDSLDYSIVTAIDFSTNTTITVQTPEGCTIPADGGLDSVAYALSDTPFGFPRASDRWEILVLDATVYTDATPGTTFEDTGFKMKQLPVGVWDLSIKTLARIETTSTSLRYMYLALSSDASSLTDKELGFSIVSDNASNATANHGVSIGASMTKEITTPTDFTLMSRTSSATGVGSTSVNYGASNAIGVIKAKCAYL